MPAVGLELEYLNDDQVQPGDILLKYGDGSKVSGLISWGQRFFQSKSTKNGQTSIVHAGIMLNGEQIIESQGDGVTINHLREGNLDYDYEVYRCKIQRIADMAGAVAGMIFSEHLSSKTAKYSIPGAAMSLFGQAPAATNGVVNATVNQLAAGKGQKFFCSQFVVLCFQYSAAQQGLSAQTIFPLDNSGYSPNKLKEELFQSSHFFKAGFLRKGIRN